jgi:hypothetical protein
MRAEELKEPLRHFQQEIKSTVDDIKTGVESGVGAFGDAEAEKPKPDQKPAAPDDRQ